MLKPAEVINQYYLEIRCKTLELAAILDRFDRAQRYAPDHAAKDDPGLVRCRKALEMLTEPSPNGDRAEQIALLFSDRSR